jgi:hypothetical protein
MPVSVRAVKAWRIRFKTDFEGIEISALVQYQKKMIISYFMD